MIETIATQIWILIMTMKQIIINEIGIFGFILLLAGLFIGRTSRNLLGIIKGTAITLIIVTLIGAIAILLIAPGLITQHTPSIPPLNQNQSQSNQTQQDTNVTHASYTGATTGATVRPDFTSEEGTALPLPHHTKMVMPNA